MSLQGFDFGLTVSISINKRTTIFPTLNSLIALNCVQILLMGLASFDIVNNKFLFLKNYQNTSPTQHGKII